MNIDLLSKPLKLEIMNENINLVEILKDCQKGTKLYTPIAGEVIFMGIREGDRYPILTHDTDKAHRVLNFTIEGKYYDRKDGECLLFPSKDVRTWEGCQSRNYQTNRRTDP